MSTKAATRIITVSSGKGGVGKTNISVNLALSLAKEGHSVCLFDADLGLANINLMLGLDPEYNLENVINGDKKIEEIILRDVHGIDIIPGSSGVERIANLDTEKIGKLSDSLSGLDAYDFLIFDTSAGIASPVTAFCMAASELLLVITPEPTSMTDAYSLLKVLVLNGFKGQINVVVNQCRNIRQVKRIYSSFQRVVQNFLGTKISLAGFVLNDERLAEAVIKQTPFLLLYPASNASKCIRHLTGILLSREPDSELNQGMSLFWERCFGFLKERIGMNAEQKKPPHNETCSGEINEEGRFEDGAMVQKESLKFKDLKSDKVENSGVKGEDCSYVDEKMYQKNENSPKNQISLNAIGDVHCMMARLVKTMENISGELHDIKNYLRNGQAIEQTRKEKPGNEGFISTVDNEIVLDYQEFLKKRAQ